MTILITITPAAQVYLTKLKQKPENLHKELRLEALDANTPYAEAGLSFVEMEPAFAHDLIIGFEGFQLFVDRKSVDFLNEATIDIQMQNLQTQIIVTTPYLQPLNLFEAYDDVYDKVEFLLQTQVNPALASHGGMVRLVEITPDHIVKLQFAGGCQGCSQSEMTLKHGIKESLMEKIPEIKDVQDVTDHALGQMPYY